MPDLQWCLKSSVSIYDRRTYSPLLIALSLGFSTASCGTNSTPQEPTQSEHEEKQIRQKSKAPKEEAVEDEAPKGEAAEDEAPKGEAAEDEASKGEAAEDEAPKGATAQVKRAFNILQLKES